MKKLFTVIALVICILSNAQIVTLKSLNYYDGTNPNGSLTSVGSYLYGMTNTGGQKNGGTIFKIKPDGTAFDTLISFNPLTGGTNPFGSLISDGVYLYGMTNIGGFTNNGTIFKIKPDGTGYTTIYSFFGSTTGSKPTGSLLLINDTLYGMTKLGGSNSFGNVFKIKTDGTGYSNLFNFNSTGTNGYYPKGSLISDGTYLYGMTSSGGSPGDGTIFKIKTNGTGFSVLTSFDTFAPLGASPQGSLLLVGSTLYGMTITGDASAGGIFKINTDGTNFNNVLLFNGTNGSSPNGSLIYDGTYLYGMTVYGGTSYGNIFKIKPDGTSFVNLGSFGVLGGKYPLSDLTLQGGVLFGLTSQGGSNNYGVIFKLCAPSTMSVNSANVCAGNSVTLTATGTSTYSWSTGATTASIIVSPTVSTSYTVTDSNGPCLNTAISTVTVNAMPVISVNSGAICNGQSFTLSSSGASTYTYSSGSAIVTPTVNTTYSVVGTSSLGCLSSNVAISSVTVNALPTVTVNSGVICSGQSFTMTAGGANTYTYSSAIAIVTPITSSSYTVTGKDLNSCINTAISSVTVNTTPTVNVNSGAICSGQSFTIFPTGASTYTFSGGSSVVTPTANAIYNVTGTSVAGCVSSNTAISSVTVNSIPTVSVNSGAICSGKSFTIIPSGASTYTISGGSSIVTPTASTNYNVMGTSATGCVSSNTAISSVTVNALPIVNVNSGAICSGQSFTIVPSGANTYTISGGLSVITPTADTNYNITGTNAVGCVSSNTAMSSVTVNPIPTVIVNSGNICSGQSFTIVPTGASTYTYSSGSANVTPTANTTYSVVGTSSFGCLSSNVAVSSVTVNALPTVTVNSGAICSGQSFTIVPSGASTYNIGGGSSVVTPTADITYNVTGTSATGCVSSNTAVSSVTVNTLPTVTVNSGAICSGQSFTIVPTGASTYTISGGLAIVTPTADATYYITGTSTAGCLSSNTAISSVTINALPTVNVNSGSICSGESFTIVPSGANTYIISGGSSVVTPTADATYNITGISAAGCVSSNTAVSSVTVSMTPTVNVNSGAICSGQSFTIFPTGASTYTISGGSSVVTPTADATYNVTGTSVAGCISSNTAVSSITVNAIPTVLVNSGAICSGQSFTIVPTGASTYTISGGASVVTPTADAIYNVTGTSVAGCVSSNTAVSSVTVNTIPIVSVNSGAICSGQSFTIVPTGASTYTISGGSSVVTPATDATYNVTGTSIAGCVSSNTAVSSVTVYSLPTIILNSGEICFGNSFTLTANGAATFTYSSGSPIVSPNTTSNYTVWASANNGCNNYATTTVTVNPLPTIDAGEDITIILGETYQFNPTQTNAVTYTWSATDGLNDANSLNPITSSQKDITYTITVSSAKGCLASDEVAVKIYDTFFINNFVSPNGDGNNDTWKISVPYLIKNCAVEIFDQWGTTVFTKENNYYNEWDPKNVVDGVYYYVFTENGKIKYSGSITVLR